MPALKHFLDASAFTQWGGRVPFLISAPIVLVATWIRMGMKETPVFVGMQCTHQLSKAPLAETLGSRSSWKVLLIAVFGAQGGTSVSLYISLSLVSVTGNVLAGVGYSIASLVPCVAVTYFWYLKRDKLGKIAIDENPRHDGVARPVPRRL